MEIDRSGQRREQDEREVFYPAEGEATGDPECGLSRLFAQFVQKSPVSEIAAEAGISKSLLFHYFRNKLELFQFLWEHSGKVTMQYLEVAGCYEQTDLFEAMLRGLRAKVRIMQRYPDMGAFVLRAYYESDEAVRKMIR